MTEGTEYWLTPRPRPLPGPPPPLSFWLLAAKCLRNGELMKCYVSVGLLTKVLHGPYFIKKKDQRSAALVQVGGPRGQPTSLHLNPRDGARGSPWHPSARLEHHCSVSTVELPRTEAGCVGGTALQAGTSSAVPFNGDETEPQATSRLPQVRPEVHDLALATDTIDPPAPCLMRHFTLSLPYEPTEELPEPRGQMPAGLSAASWGSARRLTLHRPTYRTCCFLRENLSHRGGEQGSGRGRRGGGGGTHHLGFSLQAEGILCKKERGDKSGRVSSSGRIRSKKAASAQAEPTGGGSALGAPITYQTRPTKTPHPTLSLADIVPLPSTTPNDLPVPRPRSCHALGLARIKNPTQRKRHLLHEA